MDSPLFMFISAHERGRWRARQREFVCVCVFVFRAQKCWCFSFWALSSKFSISVYNAKWEKVPVFSGGLKAGESKRKKQEPGGRCFVLERPAGLFEHFWRTYSPHGEVTVCDFMSLDWFVLQQNSSVRTAHRICNLRQILFIMLGVWILGRSWFTVKDPTKCHSFFLYHCYNCFI